mgnify:CR=1 FL=1
MSKWHGGKGSKQRPTDKDKYNENYDRIFGKKDPVKKNMDKFHKPEAKVQMQQKFLSF